MPVTLPKYILSTGVCTTSELIQFAKSDPSGYAVFLIWAREQAANLGVAIEAK